jgi:5-methylcytosine-specific restriction enzyme subunit McrC
VSSVDVALQEWTRIGPEEESRLRDLALDDERARQVAAGLTSSGALRVLELAQGISVEATSFVGAVTLGPLRVTIRPKIDSDDLLGLLRYAFGLRNLRLFADHEHALARQSFLDIILHQLAAEAMELLARGLHRRYLPQHESLASPRGRIDFTALAAQGGPVTATLPCRHHVRSEDCLHNRVLLAGLRLGTRLAADLTVRAKLRELSRLMEEQVSAVVLDGHALRQLQRESSRLTRAYDPAVRLVEVLLRGHGASVSGTARRVPLPGFLFDMNRFFQELLSRFLRENLPSYRVQDQFRLRGMLSYVPGFNPRSRRPPTPRPDFVVMAAGRPVAVLDAKYRDLWEHDLPESMLYQLAMYSLSQRTTREATILYPTVAATASEARIEVRDAVYGGERATVVQRPVHIRRLARLIWAGRTPEADRQRAEYAKYMAFG